MLENYKATLIQPTPNVLGFDLKPFTLGHARILETFDSPYIGEGAQTLEELIFAVAVCSLEYEQAVKTFNSKKLLARFQKANAKKLKRFEDTGDLWVEYRHVFNEYLKYYFQHAPRFKDGSTGNARAPWVYILYMRLSGGRVDEKVWNLPLIDAFAYAAAIAASEGDESLISEKEAAVMKFMDNE